jgi:D-glycerate 3-kinase
MPNQLPQWQAELLDRHQLARSYLDHALTWFAPLGTALAEHQSGAARPVLVAVNGSQGSGKTTLCDYLRAALQADFGLRVVSLSLDDFYFTRAQREQLSREVHPLLATRGVPGTHDMALLNRTLDGLLATGGDGPVAVPRFDKAVDDRRSPADWDRVEGAVDLVLLEGWCLGARPQSQEDLAEPVNALERDEDADGRWRAHVNRVLAEDFLPLYRRVDQWVMLQAPSFDCVYRWRLEQEQKLADQAVTETDRIMSEEQIARFIQYYQRLTRQCLQQLPPVVDHLFVLDEQRHISAYRQPRGTAA